MTVLVGNTTNDNVSQTVNTNRLHVAIYRITEPPFIFAAGTADTLSFELASVGSATAATGVVYDAAGNLLASGTLSGLTTNKNSITLDTPVTVDGSVESVNFGLIFDDYVDIYKAATTTWYWEYESLTYGSALPDPFVGGSSQAYSGGPVVMYLEGTASGSTPTISNVDGDNAVNQYQLCNVNVTGFTETIASATLNSSACVVDENDPSDDVVGIRMPGGLASGTYDFVLNGSGTETDTISGIAYTQTHPYTSPYGTVDSNSLFDGQVLTADSYHRIVSGPTNGTLDAATAESSGLWGNDVNDFYTADEGFSGDDSVTLEILYSGGTTAQWTATITVAAPDVTAPTVVSVTPTAATSLKAGDNLDLSVDVSETVVVTGTPYIPVNIGGVTKQADYVSGTDPMLFRYVIQAGDNDANGVTVGSAIVLNGGTIKDTASTPNDMVLTLNSVGDTSGLLVDTVKPVITPVGANPAYVVVDETYTDKGAIATDDQDGSLGAVTGSGSIDTSSVGGPYIITYPGAGVTDAAGNVADDATRTVYVVAEVPVDKIRSIRRAMGTNSVKKSMRKKI